MLQEGASSKEMLAYYLKKSYDDAAEGKARGEKVCWATSCAPNEFCETLGIHMLYPENHSAAIAARHGADEMIQYAENKGYSLDICSYARLNLSYMELQECVTDNMPLPDFILVCNNICEVVMKWYENIAYELKIPIITIDTPYNYEEEPSEANIDYVVAQFEDAIRRMEEISGKKFDQARFQEVMRQSVESRDWWIKAMSLASARPSPLFGFDIFNYMALIVCIRGKKECSDTFKKLAAELEEKIARGYTVFPEGEKHRIMWEGIACWPYLNFTFKTLKELGVNVAGSTYPNGWDFNYEPGNIRAMAREYTNRANNASLKRQAELRAQIVQDYDCEGVTYHMNRSCKTMDFLQHEIQQYVAKETDTPFISFDGDQSDPRNFSMAQFETRMQGLAEMMEQRKSVE